MALLQPWSRSGHYFVANLLALATLAISTTSADWDLESGRGSPCASLYSNEDHSGTKYEVTDGMTLSDTTPIAAWNQTKALRVYPGCMLTLCDFPVTVANKTVSASEVCHKFVKDTSRVPDEWFSESASAHCSCVKQCACTDIILRRKECARAYLDNDCNTCNSFYTNLKRTAGARTKEAMATRLQHKVRAVIVRPGCKLTATNSSGDLTVISGKIVEGWEGDLIAYQCICDADVTATAVQPNLGKDLPELVAVPRTSGSINAILNSRAARVQGGGRKDHPGLTVALQSLANKRSAQNAYILLLGLTGSGKSTTINFLFDNSNITRVGDQHSVTTDIHEYRISVPVLELGLNNTELRIIDTPGIIDTRGLEQDARYVATLNEYLNKHEDLRRSIPNVVLIFLKFDDNRYSGYGSNFVKMLRTIDLFRDRIMDSKFANVVFVATHYMSESRDIVRRPQQRLAALKKTIQEYTLFPAPTIISVAENKPEQAGLLSVNGFYALPNGEFYPKNLFDRIQLVTAAGGDPLGEAIIRTAFKSSDFSYSEGAGAGGIREVIFPLVAPTNAKVIEYLGILSSLNTNPSKTKISQALERAYRKLPADLKPSDESEAAGAVALGRVQRIFYLQQINTLNDLPTSTEDVYKFFKRVPRNPSVLYLIRTAFNLSVPVYEPATLIGYGYSLLEDESLPTSPLQLPSSITSHDEEIYEGEAEPDPNSGLVTTDTGFMMHRLYKCQLRSAVNTIFQSYTSNEEYVRSRLDSLLQLALLEKDTVSELAKTRFGASASTATKPGLNLIDLGLDRNDTDSERSPHQQKLSAVIEYQTFSLALDTDLATLSKEFTGVVLGLPEFNRTDWSAVESWKHFFAKYGTHVVDSCFGGGWIEITVKQATAVGPSQLQAQNVFTTHEQLTEGVGRILDYVAGLMIGKETLLNTTGIEYNLHFGGGSRKYHVESLTDPNAKQKLLNWRQSLTYEPMILEQTSPFSLLPLTDLVQKHLGAGAAGKVRDAASVLYNGSLSYDYDRASTTASMLAPADRSSTESVASTGDFVALKEFAELMHQMAGEARERNEKLITMIMEQRQESERQAAVDEENRRNRFADTMKAHQQEFERIQQGQLEDAAARTAREQREEQLRQEKFEIERQQFLQSSEAAAKRHQEFVTYIIESNRQAAEARRKNSIWTKLTDSILPTLGSALGAGISTLINGTLG